MATYLVLWNYTEQGVAAVKEGPNRVDRIRQSVREMGAELKGYYLAMGRYDGIAMFEAPDDPTMARVLLAIGAAGNARTETLRLFSEDEFRSIVASL